MRSKKTNARLTMTMIVLRDLSLQVTRVEGEVTRVEGEVTRVEGEVGGGSEQADHEKEESQCGRSLERVQPADRGGDQNVPCDDDGLELDVVENIKGQDVAGEHPDGEVAEASNRNSNRDAE